MQNRITPEHVDQLLERSEFQDLKMGRKTTVVVCRLPNGFEIVESSSALDEDNYDHEIGSRLAKQRIRERVFMLEGYLMQERMAQEAAL